MMYEYRGDNSPVFLFDVTEQDDLVLCNAYFSEQPFYKLYTPGYLLIPPEAMPAGLYIYADEDLPERLFAPLIFWRQLWQTN